MNSRLVCHSWLPRLLLHILSSNSENAILHGGRDILQKYTHNSFPSFFDTFHLPIFIANGNSTNTLEMETVHHNSTKKPDKVPFRAKM